MITSEYKLCKLSNSFNLFAWNYLPWLRRSWTVLRGEHFTRQILWVRDRLYLRALIFSLSDWGPCCLNHLQLKRNSTILWMYYGNIKENNYDSWYRGLRTHLCIRSFLSLYQVFPRSAFHCKDIFPMHGSQFIFELSPFFTIPTSCCSLCHCLG